MPHPHLLLQPQQVTLQQRSGPHGVCVQLPAGRAGRPGPGSVCRLPTVLSAAALSGNRDSATTLPYAQVGWACHAWWSGGKGRFMEYWQPMICQWEISFFLPSFSHRETFDRPNTTRWALMPHGMDNFILFKSNKHGVSKKSVPLGGVSKRGADGKEKQQMTFSVAQIPVLDTPLRNEHKKLGLLVYLWTEPSFPSTFMVLLPQFWWNSTIWEGLLIILKNWALKPVLIHNSWAATSLFTTTKLVLIPFLEFPPLFNSYHKKWLMTITKIRLQSLLAANEGLEKNLFLCVPILFFFLKNYWFCVSLSGWSWKGWSPLRVISTYS